MGVMYLRQLDRGCVGEDYTIFVGVSWNYKSEIRNGSAVYMIIDRKGNNGVHMASNIVDTNSVRLVLLSIWSGLKNVPDNKLVRVVTKCNTAIQTLGPKNMSNDACSDLKAHIAEELSRLKKVYISRPLSATDESYVNEVSKLAYDGREEYERKTHK